MQSFTALAPPSEPDRHPPEAERQVLLNFGVTFKPFVVSRAKGVYLYTTDDRKLLDWSSGQMASLLGHSHPTITKAITTAAGNLDHLLSCNISPPVIELASRLVDLLPPGLDKAMFLSTGSEACEAAIRMAKLVTGRYEVVGLGSSWHGMTGASVAAQYHSGRKGYGPVIPGNFSLPSPDGYRSIFRKVDGSYDWQTELDYGWEAVDRSSCGSLAAVIVEPILSSGGMLVLPRGYLSALKAHCDRRGMLLIVGEAQTGIGRCGTMFAFEEEDIVPDILLLSKTFGAGFPLSAVLTSNHISRECEARNFFFCTTHVNDRLAATIGSAVLKTILEENLVGRAKVVGERLLSGLKALQNRYGCMGDVRGRAMLTAIEIVADTQSKSSAPEVARALDEKMLQLDLSINLTCFGRIFRIAPPLIITDEQLEWGLQRMAIAFRDTPGTLPIYTATQRDTLTMSPQRAMPANHMRGAGVAHLGG